MVATSSQSLRAPAELPRARLAIYALPVLGASAPTCFVQFYFLSFATDALLLAPAGVAALLAAGRIWDALSDPLAGWASDRTRTRWGRRRPWLALSAPACALSFLALWNPPEGLGTQAGLTLWCGAALFAFTAAITAWGIPHQALAVELSEDPHTRTRIFGLRFVAALLGVALSFGGMQWVATSSEPRDFAGALAGWTALGMLALLWLPAIGLRERPVLETPPRDNPFRAARDVVADRDARRLLAIWFLTQLGMSAQGVIAPYMSRYVMQRPELVGVLPALFIAPLLASVPGWIRLARRYGRRRVWRISMLGASASYALLFLLPPHDLLTTGLLLASAGFFTGCGGPVGPSLFASAADAAARRSGERREGIVFAAKEFVEKASGAAVVLVVGAALQLLGFEPNVEQSESVQWAIRACLGLLPCAMLLLSALLLRDLALADEAR